MENTELEKEVLRLKTQISVLESFLATVPAIAGQPLLTPAMMEVYRQRLADEFHKRKL